MTVVQSKPIHNIRIVILGLRIALPIGGNCDTQGWNHDFKAGNCDVQGWNNDFKAMKKSAPDVKSVDRQGSSLTWPEQ